MVCVIVGLLWVFVDFDWLIVESIQVLHHLQYIIS
jgi:hypothetical protein